MPPDKKRSASSRSPVAAMEVGTPALSHLLAHAARLRRLEYQLRIQLPWAESASFELANVRTGTLVLITPLATVASRLRLEQTRILQVAARYWDTPISKLIVKTNPAKASTSPLAESSTLSPAAGRQLRAAASTLTDPELRDLLLRMASLAD